MSGPTPRVCVAHLARAANGVAPLRTFLESYRRHPAGINHELLIVFKGFREPLGPEFEQALANVAHRRRFIADDGFDVDAYFDTARSHDAEMFCFLNSFSVILVDSWLEKLSSALAQRDAGVVGATGSWQSVYSNILDAMNAPPSFPPGYPEWKHFLVRRFPFLRKIRLYVRRRLLRGMFDPFPNYHLRTNAFLIARATALRVRLAPTRRKFDAYRFESGTQGFSRQVLAMGKRLLVVGRDGTAYDMQEWYRSNTFWRSNQENLLVGDNQTRMYDALDPETRIMFSTFAWGPAADPGLK